MEGIWIMRTCLGATNFSWETCLKQPTSAGKVIPQMLKTSHHITISEAFEASKSQGRSF
jgi:hypothetical protein